MINGYKKKLDSIYSKIREDETRKLRERFKEIEKLHPETLTPDQAINTITQIVDSFFKGIENGQEDLEMFNEELMDQFKGGDISWETFTGIVNKMIGYLKENYEDDANDVIRDLTNLLNSCPI